MATIEYPWRNLLTEPVLRDHFVQVYRDERVLIEAVALFAGAALGRQEAALIIATADHRRKVEACLADDGFEVDDLKRWRQLMMLDAQDMLDRFMVDGMPEPALFKSVIREVVRSVKRSGQFNTVRAYGEMVNLLWRGNLPAALRLEELWNEAVQELSLSLFCAYCLDGEGKAQRTFPPDLRAVHNHFIPVEAGEA
jgi:hypothetical protein